TGVDNSDLAAATRRGVVVMNAPGGNSVSVAEHTVALLLALARQVAGASSSTRAGKWAKKKFAAGRELLGKTLGVLGTGSMGTVRVQRLAEAPRKGSLGGAALDGGEQEPPPSEHPLFGRPNLIAPPRLAASPEDAQQIGATMVWEAMVEYLTTGTIRTAVNVP